MILVLKLNILSQLYLMLSEKIAIIALSAGVLTAVFSSAINSIFSTFATKKTDRKCWINYQEVSAFRLHWRFFSKCNILLLCFYLCCAYTNDCSLLNYCGNSCSYLIKFTHICLFKTVLSKLSRYFLAFKLLLRIKIILPDMKCR